MEFLVKDIASRLKISGPDMITRPVGRSVFSEIEKKLKSRNSGETVVFDCEGIKVMDLSFIDECIVRTILLSREEPVFYLRLRNISDIAEINIDSVFNSYSVYNSDRIAAVTENICRNNSFFIGSLSELEKDIFEFIRKNKVAAMDDIIHYTKKDRDEIEKLVAELDSLRVLRVTGRQVETV